MITKTPVVIKSLHSYSFRRQYVLLLIMKILYTVVLLVISNIFMNLAWYGHLKFKEWKIFEGWGLWGVIMISWLIAFFEYCVQVPANRVGYVQNGGPFSLMQLKLTQEVLSIAVFIVLQQLLFKDGSIKWNHIVSFAFILAAVYFAYYKD